MVLDGHHSSTQLPGWPRQLFAWFVMASVIHFFWTSDARCQTADSEDTLFPDIAVAADDNVLKIDYPSTDDATDWMAFANRDLSKDERQSLDNAVVLLLDSHGPSRLRASAARTLGGLCHRNAIGALLSVADNRYDDIHARVEAIEALSRIPHETAVDELIRQLNDPRVSLDAIRGLLLLQGNVLELTSDDLEPIKDLYRSNVAEKDQPIGGYRSILNSLGGAYGPTFPEDVQKLLEDNVLSGRVQQKCEELRTRYQRWISEDEDWPSKWRNAYEYGLLHGTPASFSGNGDAFSYVLTGTLENPNRDSIVHVNLVKLGRVPVHQLRNDGIYQRSEYLQGVFGRLPDVEKVADLREKLIGMNASPVVLKVLDPLESWSGRADAANAIGQEHGVDGLAALRAVAANRFDHGRVRSACVTRLAELAPAESRKLIVACVADPRVMDAAIEALPGATEELRRRGLWEGVRDCDLAMRRHMAIRSWLPN